MTEQERAELTRQAASEALRHLPAAHTLEDIDRIWTDSLARILRDWTAQRKDVPMMTPRNVDPETWRKLLSDLDEARRLVQSEDSARAVEASRLLDSVRRILHSGHCKTHAHPGAPSTFTCPDCEAQDDRQWQDWLEIEAAAIADRRRKGLVP